MLLVVKAVIIDEGDEVQLNTRLAIKCDTVCQQWEKLVELWD